jgi:CheY-like chemotaxis protein
MTGSIEIGCNRKGDLLEFFVKDTGTGVPQEHKELIFERFRQGSELLNRSYEGAGLGLSISKAYVEMLGGRIWVESGKDKQVNIELNEDTGSTFYFTIPWNPVQELKDAKKAEAANFTAGKQAGMLKILIVEDDTFSEMFISNITKKIAKEVLYARTGYEAVETCRVHSDIDLVLMDMKMPKMDGYEATRLIRKFNKEVLIIAQTAYGLSGDKEKAIEAGCNDYIAKPINQGILIKKIKDNLLK